MKDIQILYSKNCFTICDEPVFEIEKLSELYNVVCKVLDIEPITVVITNSEYLNFIAGYGHLITNEPDGAFCPKEYFNSEIDLILIKNDSISPKYTLFHELGHYIWQKKFSNEERNKWYEYMDRNTKIIDINKIANVLKTIEKFQEFWKSDRGRFLFLKMLDAAGYDFKTQVSFNHDTLSKIAEINHHRIYTKYETTYWTSEEEVFCETFSRFVFKNCRFKSNHKIIESLLFKNEELIK